MKTIGLIGGMSWESTVTYYQIINEIIKEKLGGFHSARILLSSVDFAEIEQCQTTGDWDLGAEILSQSAVNLEKAGADFILICTNTMHKVAPQIQSSITIPVIHIADATADILVSTGIKKVALLGTKYTMTQDFYKERLVQKGLEPLIPAVNDREIINNIIFNELCLGIISDDSRRIYLDIIGRLRGQGAEGIILGCTEIGLLINQNDLTLPVFDTTAIHARAAAEQALLFP